MNSAKIISCHSDGELVYINLNNVNIISKQNGHCRFSYVGGGFTEVDESMDEISEKIFE